MQDETNPYLEQDVLSASPPKLRLMLISKADELCNLVQFLWQNGKDQEANGWLLRVREILGELLGGVQDKDNPAGKDVTDLYVFMLQLLTSVEQTQSSTKLNQLKSLLEIEKETWRQVNESISGGQPASGSTEAATNVPAPTYLPGTDQSLPGGSFSVEV
ncbi:MAG: hypothetical protein Aurels2KO_27500 [Aureliella sp.]